MSYADRPDGQLALPGLEDLETPPAPPKKQRPVKPVSELIAISYLDLDISPGQVNLLGEHYWELRSPYREDGTILNTGPAPREPIRTSLSDVLELDAKPKYYLSRTACLGILRRAEERDKALPSPLQWALMVQAGLEQPSHNLREVTAYHGAPQDKESGLYGISEAPGIPPEMKQQVFAAGITAKGNGDCFLSAEQHTALSCGGGMPGQGYPCALVAGFSAGAGAKAGSIGYAESIAPTLKGTASGNCMPSVLCLNDQGGKIMACSEDVSGALRAQEHGHQPLVFDAHGQDTRYRGPVKCSPTLSANLLNHPLVMDSSESPKIYENHGIDARYTGPHPVAPTLSARAGTGGNNLPLVEQGPPEAICIMGNAIDRQPHNGGNGIGYQADIAYTLTATDHHAVFSRQRVDAFKENEVVSTQSARQYKDATDLICRPATGGAVRLIRRLTPLECERLQGFPDGWTGVTGASDSARYKALGNSVAIPCVEFIMAGIVLALNTAED